MDRFSYALVKSAVAAFGVRPPVWEIGSYRVEGQERHGDLRALFGGAEYVGCDMRKGPCVDRIEDVTRLGAADGSVGTLICLNTLEHVFETMKGFSEIARVTAEGGMAIVNFPFYFKVHDYPGDFWRITPMGMAEALSGFGCRIVGSVGWETTPTAVFAVAMKGEPDDLEGRFAQFLSALQADAAEPAGIARPRKGARRVCALEQAAVSHANTCRRYPREHRADGAVGAARVTSAIA